MRAINIAVRSRSTETGSYLVRKDNPSNVASYPSPTCGVPVSEP